MIFGTNGGIVEYDNMGKGFPHTKNRGGVDVFGRRLSPPMVFARRGLIGWGTSGVGYWPSDTGLDWGESDTFPFTLSQYGFSHAED